MTVFYMYTHDRVNIFFFNDTATTEIYTLSLHDALPILDGLTGLPEAIETIYPHTRVQLCMVHLVRNSLKYVSYKHRRSEEHTSELQSQSNFVCRLLLEKKKHPSALPYTPTYFHFSAPQH